MEQSSSNNRTLKIIPKHSKDTFSKNPIISKEPKDTILQKPNEMRSLKRNDSLNCPHNSCPTFQNQSYTLLNPLKAVCVSAPKVNSEIEEIIHEARDISEEQSSNHITTGFNYSLN